jgi:hypothetical protein
MQKLISRMCLVCKHRHRLYEDKKNQEWTCDAFPDAIPERFLNGTERHLKPTPEQKPSIVFERKK